MGLIVDIVPNHLGVMGDDNAWWLDVLENGPAARAAHHFDIDWRPNRGSMRDRVLVPVLGDAYGAVLERGELQLQLDPAAGSFAIRYHEHLLPIDPREYPRIFAPTPIAAAVLDAGRCASRRFRKPAERVRQSAGAQRYLRGRDRDPLSRQGGAQAPARAPAGAQSGDPAAHRSDDCARQRHAGRSAQLRRSRRVARSASLSAVVLARGGR